MFEKETVEPGEDVGMLQKNDTLTTLLFPEFEMKTRLQIEIVWHKKRA